MPLDSEQLQHKFDRTVNVLFIYQTDHLPRDTVFTTCRMDVIKSFGAIAMRKENMKKTLIEQGQNTIPTKYKIMQIHQSDTTSSTSNNAS